MSRISIAFFATAVLYALSGMALGMVMGASGDFSAASLHSHINLLGWASLAAMGAFYGIAGDRAPARLAWANFAASNIGNLMALAMLSQIAQGKPPIAPVLIAGQVLIVLGTALFGLAVVMVGRKPA